jgi:serine/threonine protein kinase
MTLIRGVKVSSYEIVSAIGRGETGEVYLAKDLERDGNVAVKVMRDELASDPERFEQFETEARAASALQHPNIITIHDIGVHNSRPFVAMEYVEGRTLQEILLDGPLPIDELLSMAAQTADGLAEAHTAGIVHRELTPDNLMITKDGRVKILNFGLAALLSETTDQEADTNTNGYVSPEQAAGGEADYHSDQFSFGTILYEMATGAHPSWGETAVQTGSAIIDTEPKAISDTNPDLPAELSLIVERCLSKDPDERYGSTRDLARELARMQKGPVTRLFAELSRGIRRFFGPQTQLN